jgi:DNA-binding response OmpR family regulator
VCATWPQRALIRAQLAADTGRAVVGADGTAMALRWLQSASFALVVLDTQGLAPDPRLVEAIGARRTPVVLVTGPFDRARWAAALAGLEARATLVRPIFIGNIARAVRLVLSSTGQLAPAVPSDEQRADGGDGRAQPGRHAPG